MADNEEMDIIELETDDGETIQLCVEKYFFYNGDEYVLLSDRCTAGEGEEISRYVIKVQPLADEEDEDMEEFVPVDDELTEKLIRVVETTFDEEQDDE